MDTNKNEEGKKVILETCGLCKYYGGVKALVDANFKLYEGEHVAVVGDNGAGKSTIIRQITGVEIPTKGEIYFYGKKVNFKNPTDGIEAGIETVHQNLALADDLDVPSNIFLGREKKLSNFGVFSILDNKKMLDEALAILKKTAVKIFDVKSKVGNMSGGQRQCVAISRSAGFASKLIIMDEPTAALGVQETTQVENIIHNLKKRGIPLIIISHNLRQVFKLVDKVWVFRRGRIVGCLDAKKTDANEVVSLITGVQRGVHENASYI